MGVDLLSIERLSRCRELINPYIDRTPVMTSPLLDAMSGSELYFKCENFQRSGSYKMRGATHALLNLSAEELSYGVVTHSSGNFAQAIALAAKKLGVKAHIVMPKSAPFIKKKGVLGYGGLVYECESTLDAREKEAKRLTEALGAVFVHPSNDLEVILGQGTAFMELMEDISGLENIVTPVGGGGLIGGTAFAVSNYLPHCNVYGAEPMEADDAYRSFHSGVIESNTTTNTIADGLKSQLGTHSFALIRSFVKGIILVSEQEIIDAMKLIWEDMKLVVEPSSAVALAAVLKAGHLFRNTKTGIIISGGNVDLENLPFKSA